MLKSEGKANENRQKAVALRYRAEEDSAPVVIASGYGQIADKIIGIAEEKGIPVFKDDSAASMLVMLEVGRSIPAELYEVIAAIYMQILTASDKIKHKTAAAVPAAPSTGPLERAEEMRRRILESQAPK